MSWEASLDEWTGGTGHNELIGILCQAEWTGVTEMDKQIGEVAHNAQGLGLGRAGQCRLVRKADQ